MLELRADINHKRRAHVIVERGVDDLERTMRLELRRAGILRTDCGELSAESCMRVEFRQPREKARLVAQHRTSVMIRMASLPVRQNYYARPSLADDARHLEAIVPGIFHAAIGNIESSAPADTENPCRVGSLSGAIFGGTARAHFPLRQIEDAGPLPALRHLQERTAASLLDVVSVRGYGKNFEGSCRHVSLDCLVRARHSRARSVDAPPFLSA